MNENDNPAQPGSLHQGTEVEILRLKSLYVTLSKINHAIIRVRNQQTLFHEICRIAIEFGNYRMAWIGLVDHVSGFVKPVDFAGEELGYLTDIDISYTNSDLGLGPVGTSIRDERCIISQDIDNDPFMIPWREKAIRRGYHSMASVPFRLNGIVAGAFAVYAGAPNAFDADDENLLTEIGENISFALDSFSTEESRRHAEDALRESEERWKSIILTSPDGIAIADLDGTLIFASEKLREIFGYASTEEIKGENLFEFVDESYHDKITSLINDLVIGNYHSAAEFLLRKKDESRFYMEVNAEILRDKEGNPVRLIFIARNITDRKQAEEALVESEKHFRTLADSGQALIWTSGIDRKLNYFNQPWLTFTGLTTHEDPDNEMAQCIHPDDLQQRTNTYLHEYEARRKYNIEYRLRHNSGEYQWIQEAGSPRYNSHGDFIGYIGHCLDITESKRMHDAIEKRIVALTRPLNKDTTILFDELFDLKNIQALQDSFADATGVASIIVFPDGTPVTRPSHFTRLCNDIIRQTEKGCANCLKSDAFLGSPHKDGPVIKPCLSGGLWDAGASITVGGHHIASWLIGQIRGESQTQESMLNYAREIGANEKEFLEAFSELPVMPLKQFEKVAQSLFLLANQLSAFAYQNIQQSRFISERVQAEENLRETEKQFRDFFENAADAIFVAEIDSKIIVDANLAASRLMQMPHEKIIGLHQSQLHPPEFKAQSETTFELHQQTALQSNSTHPIENQVIRANGTCIPVEILASNVTINGKHCLMGTFRDITERKFMEDAVFENEKRYRQLVESSPYGIAVYQDGQFVYVNTAAIKLLGAGDVSELLGLPVLSVFHPRSRNEVINRIKLVAAGNAVPAIEEIIIRLDGSHFDAEVITLSTIFNNKPAGQVIVRDITDSKLAKAEIYKLNDELEQRVVDRTKELEAANKELESFSYSVSHDLRSPLRAMDGFANILLEDYGTVLDTEGNRLLSVIIKNANKMSQLIDDLLAFSRLGRQEIKKGIIDMHDMALSVYEELVTDAEKESIDFRLHDIPETNGDPALIRQVLLNLISNAIKYTSKKTDRIIEIRYTNVDDETIYSVTDNGAGFDMTQYDKMFGVFQRFHTPKDFEGIGIGLAIVQRIINRHKGHIWAKGEVGNGATFYFTLPVFKSEK